MLDLCWTEWQWDTFFSYHIGFPPSVSFHQGFILIFIFMLLLLKHKRAMSGNL